MKRPDKTVGFRLSVELLEKIQYIARFECRSTSSVIRLLIREHVEQFEREHGIIEGQQGPG